MPAARRPVGTVCGESRFGQEAAEKALIDAAITLDAKLNGARGGGT
ncbi:hypothetical protein AB0E25_31405 [Streptomyces bobili]